jgi:uncharacterized protein YrrD
MREIRKVRSLKGLELKARDGDVGTLKQLFFDDQDWTVRYLMATTGIWFLGRDVLISPKSVIEVNQETDGLVVALSCQQIKDSPEFVAGDTLSRQYEEGFHEYYGLAPYWQHDASRAGTPAADAVESRAKGETGQRPAARLRSSDEVTGYAIQARDGEVGKVSDLLVDDSAWNVRYIEVDTGKWLAGSRVLLAPAWVGSIDWSANLVRVPLDCAAIRSAPEYKPGRLVDRDYEISLFAHYGKSWTEDP